MIIKESVVILLAVADEEKRHLSKKARASTLLSLDFYMRIIMGS